MHDKQVRRRRAVLGVLVGASLILLTAYFGESQNSPLHSVQRGIVERFAGDDGYLPRLGRAGAAARAAGIPVIYVTVGFRPGHPEISARNSTLVIPVRVTPAA